MLVTYKGQPSGEILQTVVPDANSITVHLHHSFIRLPDGDYDPLPYEPRAGIIGISYGMDGYFDYASEIGDALAVGYGRRHRLHKKDPSADVSEAVEPIVYYVDRGAPEPIRSALLEGAYWWNEAFTAAGYENAFRVDLMPRWISGPKDKLEAFIKANKGHMAQDHDGDPVYMTRLQWDIDRVIRDWPEIKLSKTKETHV